MNALLKTILSNGVVRAKIKKYANSASIAVGTATLTLVTNFLMTHASFLSTTSDGIIAAFVATTATGAVLTLGSVILEQVDVGNVSAKVIAVAATGDVASANDNAIVKQIKAAAGTPEALDALVAKLKSGAV